MQTASRPHGISHNKRLIYKRYQNLINNNITRGPLQLDSWHGPSEAEQLKFFGLYLPGPAQSIIETIASQERECAEWISMALKVH